MMSIRIRRTVVVLVLAAASSIVPSGLNAAPRERPAAEHRAESRGDRALRQSFPLWHFLVGLWEHAGLRIDDNG